MNSALIPRGIKVINGANEPVPTSGSITDLEIFNLPSTPNTELNHTITNGTQALLIKTRKLTKILVAFGVGETSTKYMTVPQGSPFYIDCLKLLSKTIYLKTENNNTIEILEFR